MQERLTLWFDGHEGRSYRSEERSTEKPTLVSSQPPPKSKNDFGGGEEKTFGEGYLLIARGR
jgi:hypothetical protein